MIIKMVRIIKSHQAAKSTFQFSLKLLLTCYELFEISMYKVYWRKNIFSTHFCNNTVNKKAYLLFYNQILQKK